MLTTPTAPLATVSVGRLSSLLRDAMRGKSHDVRFDDIPVAFFCDLLYTFYADLNVELPHVATYSEIGAALQKLGNVVMADPVNRNTFDQVCDRLVRIRGEKMQLQDA